MEPGKTFNYVIEIPKEHPAGTHWYHPHLHGGTAVQQSSGMSGALIVEGGLDEAPEIKAAKEQVMMLQQFTYDQTGQLEDFDAAFGPGAWRASQRLTLVNGQLAPTIVMRPGEVQRWRIIQAGTRENIALKLEGHSLFEIAADGIALGRMVSWNVPLIMAPGYREDVLAPQSVVFDVDFARCASTGECTPGCVFKVEGCKVAYTINGREFNAAHRRILHVGQAAEWTLSAKIAIHPFHIHVNPFQTARLEPDGQRHLIWKDTIQVRGHEEPLKLRMRYSDFTGTTVLHCHILDHEDQGMMDLIQFQP